MYSLESPHRGDSNEYTQHTIIVKEIKKIPKLSLFASWPGTMINPQWLELPMSRTIFYGPKDVRAIEVRLYIELGIKTYNNDYHWLEFSNLLTQPNLVSWYLIGYVVLLVSWCYESAKIGSAPPCGWRPKEEEKMTGKPRHRRYMTFI